ncbi:MAG: NYN domain-containing protein, partial [Chlorobiales bacterium]|nr:NYN domain-containing protein [Chlorobiales bacterium]
MATIGFMPYLIDGNNLRGVILSNDELFAPVTDGELCGDICRYLGRQRDNGEVVFDGTGPPNKAPFYQLRGLDVTFAGEGSDADSVIEGRLERAVNTKRLVVVSDDRRLRRAARRAKTQSLRCVDFWQRVVDFKHRRPRPAEPSSKRHGLNQEETQRWMTTFGLEEKNGSQ